CTNVGSGYQCQCSPGFQGTTCEVNTNVGNCNYTPCMNGGTCIASGNTFVCACPFGYSGGRCEEQT
ncbi:unnamed protein product, partial [Rotaria magnacalcarata]